MSLDYPLVIENPRELSFDATYSRKLTENLSGGLSIRYIWSNLLGNSTGAPSANSGKSLAFDLGFYYVKPMVISGLDTDFSLGAHISNLGQKISYTSEEFEDFIPANLRIGMALKMNLDQYNSFTFIFDMNKLLVPTPPIYERDTDGNLVLDVMVILSLLQAKIQTVRSSVVHLVLLMTPPMDLARKCKNLLFL